MNPGRLGITAGQVTKKGPVKGRLTGLTNLDSIEQAPRGSTSDRCTLRIEAISSHSPVTVHFHSSSNRVYSLLSATNLAEPNWTKVPGQTAVPGTGGMDTLSDTNSAPTKFYKVGVSVPD